mmetsp:Transcript_18286/g.25426  ORF Transcript_18286/g.25426 Transcript_18286/m.25426 type:complete len:478 (+) Transcript_18286:197-1630(+)
MTSRSLLHLLIFAWGLNGCSIREQAFVDGGPGKDGIPAIDTPDFNDINIADLSDSSMVLGVYYNGTARAYPTYILRWHEIVNDKFGPFSVAITYSVLAGSSVGFLIPHEFEGIGTSGKLYENNLVMYDRGTDREWVQLLGQRTGSCDFLNRIPLMHTKWGTWRTLHPDSKLLSTRTGYDRDYSVDPYPQYANNEDIYFTTSYRRGSSPYVLHSTKSDCYLLTLSSQTHDQYIFPQSVISEVGSYAYKVFNKSIGPGGDYIQRTYEADYVLDSFGIQPKNNMEIADYLVVVAYHPKDELIAAWMIATNVSMNGTSWEKNFAIINGSTIYNYLGLIPPLKWSFDDYEAEGIFHAFLNISEGFAAPFLGSPDIDKNGTNGYNASLNVEIAGNSTSNYSLNFIKIPVRYNCKTNLFFQGSCNNKVFVQCIDCHYFVRIGSLLQLFIPKLISLCKTAHNFDLRHIPLKSSTVNHGGHGWLQA